MLQHFRWQGKTFESCTKGVGLYLLDTSYIHAEPLKLFTRTVNALLFALLQIWGKLQWLLGTGRNIRRKSCYNRHLNVWTTTIVPTALLMRKCLLWTPHTFCIAWALNVCHRGQDEKYAQYQLLESETLSSQNWWL